ARTAAMQVPCEPLRVGGDFTIRTSYLNQPQRLQGVDSSFELFAHKLFPPTLLFSKGAPSEGVLTNAEKFVLGLVDVRTQLLRTRAPRAGTCLLHLMLTSSHPHTCHGNQLREAGASLGLRLYLSFQLRNDCRHAFSAGWSNLRNAPDSGASSRLVPVSPSSTTPELSSTNNWESCGYEGHHPKQNTSALTSASTSIGFAPIVHERGGEGAKRSGCRAEQEEGEARVTAIYTTRLGPTYTLHYLLTSLGACEEYTANSTSLQPVSPDQACLLLGPGSFFAADGAAFCTQPQSFVFWLSFISTLLVVLFLIWLRRKTQLAVRLEDKQMVTTADFAVRFTGLQAGIPADKLRVWLAEELTRLLAISPDSIAHIEIGRQCAEELDVIGRFTKLKDVSEREELEAYRCALEAQGRSVSHVEAKLSSIHAQVAVLVAMFDILLDAYDLLSISYWRVSARVGPPHLVLPLIQPNGHVDWMSSALRLIGYLPPKCLRVDAAPEPWEVKWENLMLSDQHQATK
ncbi:MAG: hypothetical protein SGPRY_003476, partial [Prymnesium sp.]